jgi:hypothetical protein
VDQAYVIGAKSEAAAYYHLNGKRVSYMPAKTVFYNYHSKAKNMWDTGSDTFNTDEIDVYRKGIYSWDTSGTGPISVYPLERLVYLEAFPNDQNVTEISNERIALPIFYE